MNKIRIWLITLGPSIGLAAMFLVMTLLLVLN